MTVLVRAATLTHYFDVAESLAFDPKPLLAEVGLSPRQLADPEQRIPVETVVRLLDESAKASQCNTFGLRMASSRQLASFGALSLLLSHLATLRDALIAVVQYQHLVNPSLAIYIEESGDTTILREEIVGSKQIESRQSSELALGALHRLCATLLGSNWQPLSANFVHAEPEDLKIHRQLFKCALRFGCEFNGMVCRTVDLDRPSLNADPAMARYAKQFVDSLSGPEDQSIIHEVRKTIYLLLPMGRATIEQVASGLGSNVRTLQRQLEDSDVVFSELLSDVRKELVERYLRNSDFTLAQISDLLGYSVPSSFTRWFRGQFDQTPQQWRSSNLGNA